MGTSKAIGPKRQSKIRELVKLGLTDTEISRALHLSKPEVLIIRELISKEGENISGNNKSRKIRDITSKGGENFVESNTQKPVKEHEKRDSTYTSDDNNQQAGQTGADVDRSGSGHGEHGISINYVGGHPMKKKTDDDDTDENECGRCGTKFQGNPRYCPGCGVEFEEEE